MDDSPKKTGIEDVEAQGAAAEASEVEDTGGYIPYTVPPIPGTAQQPAGQPYTQQPSGEPRQPYWRSDAQGASGQGGFQPPCGQPVQPAPGQPPYAQPPYGQPMYGQPPYSQPPYSQPPYGQTPYGQTPYGQTPYGQPPYGQAPYGQPPYGQQPFTPPSYSQPMVAKDHVAAGLLAIFLGVFGVHKFYLGYNTAGFVMLAITILGSLFTLGLAAGVIWVIAVIEGIIYFTKSQSEFDAIYVARKKEWF